MIKIIFPIAGSSDLYSNAGYIYPKPLIEIYGKSMIELVLEKPGEINLNHQFIFIVKDEDCIKYHLDNTLKLLSSNSEIVKLKKMTKGGLCSVLMAIDLIHEDDSLLILNGDQIIDIDFNYVHNKWVIEDVDCGLVTFKSVHPRWSYAKIENGFVVETAEKNPISNNAIAGYYYFKNARDFFEGSFKSIKNDSQLDGSYYISTVVNELILKNKNVRSFQIETDKYHSFYSPQLLLEYERKNKNN